MARTTPVVVVLFSLFSALAIPAAGDAGAHVPEPRVVAVIRDCTPSFARYAEDARHAIARIAGRIGPGDTMVLIDLGGRFDARTQVDDITLDPVPAQALRPPATLLEYRKAQATLDERWGVANRETTRFLERLAQPCSRNGTDIPAVLDYTAHMLSTLQGRNQLILLSDLETDTTGVRSSLPPANAFRFRDVGVTAMFVPWKGSAETTSRMDTWREWFLKAGAASFASHDEAQSRKVTPVEASQVPTRASSPFGHTVR